MTYKDLRLGIREWQNYIIIGLVSFITIFCLPFIGSNIGLKLILPNTFAGWMVYTVSKVMVAMINVLLFHCFMQQAKINIKDDPKYREANEILSRLGYLNKWEPRGPLEWQKLQYKRKGTTIAISTLISAVGLSQAILAFDWIMLVSYAIIIIFGLIFGVLQMSAAEEYWTAEYWEYAKVVEKQMAMDKTEPTD